MADLKISQFSDGSAVEPTDEIATNRAGVNTKVHVGSAAAADIGTGPTDIPTNGDLGSAAYEEIGTGPTDIPTNADLGSAAYEEIGTGIGQIPVLQDVDGNPGLPAVDGSQLTNVVQSSQIKVTVTDTTPGYLDDKVTVGVGITKETISPTGDADLKLDVRHLVTSVSASSGTVNLNITNGDYFAVTVSGVVTLTATMDNGQGILVRAIGFDSFNPNVLAFDFGAAGVPVWTAKDDFAVYRDTAGNYKAALILSGAS